MHESIKEFMNKPNKKKSSHYLNKGITVRDIAGMLGVSLNLVVNVRKNHKHFNGVIEA